MYTFCVRNYRIVLFWTSYCHGGHAILVECILGTPAARCKPPLTVHISGGSLVSPATNNLAVWTPPHITPWNIISPDKRSR